MNQEIEAIEFTESYVLGWKYERNGFTVYTELLLRNTHPNWEEFDAKKYFGCYKLAVLTFSEVTSLVGAEDDFLPLRWNEELGEYYDYDEFESFELQTNSAIITLHKQKIKIEFAKFEFEILDSQQFIDEKGKRN